MHKKLLVVTYIRTLFVGASYLDKKMAEDGLREEYITDDEEDDYPLIKLSVEEKQQIREPCMVSNFNNQSWGGELGTSFFTEKSTLNFVEDSGFFSHRFGKRFLPCKLFQF